MSSRTLLQSIWWLLLCGWTASEVAILLVTRTRRSTGKVRDRGSLLLLWPVILIAINLGIWIGDNRPHTLFAGAAWVRPLALAVMIAGIAIRWSAILTLGRSFSANVAIHATQQLQRNGLFRIVRHPSYTGLILIFAAIGLHTRNWLGLAAVLLPSVAALLYRIHVEEIALESAFGEDYADYKRTTKRLIPGLY
jgi:protein-S-isoprenylcysteine O-methyltransferase Ste14